jgi:citrate synthase
MTDWITAAEAADRLGIKQASLYAYVSRGVLSRRREPGGRASMFAASEVEALARKGRPRRGAGTAEFVFESALTEITGSTQRYRGHDATDLALRSSFEDVAMLLWTGSLPEAAGEQSVLAGGSWQATDEALAAGRAAQAALPPGTLPLERLQVIVPALAATDQFRLHLDLPAVVAAGKALVAGMVGALPEAATSADRLPQAQLPTLQSASPEPGVAARMAPKLCTGSAPSGLIRVLNAALVLVADHELAASTLAARVAASMRADPYAVVATGLGAMGGALHGGAALGAELMLGSASSPADAPRVVGDLLRRGEKLPGFGHFVYKDGDPRADLLLRLVAELAPKSPQLAIASAVTDEARRRALPEPNIEFALAVLAQVAGMTRGAGEAIFATGRTAGWLAHALEEYERNVPIRPRSVYTGPTAVS